jgi:hypothetical protein
VDTRPQTGAQQRAKGEDMTCEICGNTTQTAMIVVTHLGGHWVCTGCRQMMAYLFTCAFDDWFDRAAAHFRSGEDVRASFWLAAEDAELPDDRNN